MDGNREVMMWWNKIIDGDKNKCVDDVGEETMCDNKEKYTHNNDEID